jgi:hypothetical protein
VDDEEKKRQAQQTANKQVHGKRNEEEKNTAKNLLF